MQVIQKIRDNITRYAFNKKIPASLRIRELTELEELAYNLRDEVFKQIMPIQKPDDGSESML